MSRLYLGDGGAGGEGGGIQPGEDAVVNNLQVKANALIEGGLQVLGTTTIIDSTTISLEDPIVDVNRSAGSVAAAGIRMVQPNGSLPNKQLIHNTAANQLQYGDEGSESPVAMLTTSIITDEGVLVWDSVTERLQEATAGTVARFGGSANVTKDVFVGDRLEVDGVVSFETDEIVMNDAGAVITQSCGLRVYNPTGSSPSQDLKYFRVSNEWKAGTAVSPQPLLYRDEVGSLVDENIMVYDVTTRAARTPATGTITNLNTTRTDAINGIVLTAQASDQIGAIAGKMVVWCKTRDANRNELWVTFPDGDTQFISREPRYGGWATFNDATTYPLTGNTWRLWYPPTSQTMEFQAISTQSGGTGTIVSASDAGGGEVQFTTGANHTLSPGNIVSIVTGAYTGLYIVVTATPLTTTFTVTETFTATTTGDYYWGKGFKGQQSTAEYKIMAAGMINATLNTPVVRMKLILNDNTATMAGATSEYTLSAIPQQFFIQTIWELSTTDIVSIGYQRISGTGDMEIPSVQFTIERLGE